MLGRFISPDSIVPNPANPGLFNRFAYVTNSPLVYTDPTGHCSYAGENDSCDFIEEGSTALIGLFTAYAEVRMETADYYLDVYDYYGLSSDAEKADAVLFDGFESAVASKQKSLEDVVHPQEDPVDTDLWGIQPRRDSRFDATTMPRRDNSRSARLSDGDRILLRVDAALSAGTVFAATNATAILMYQGAAIVAATGGPPGWIAGGILAIGGTIVLVGGNGAAYLIATN